MKVKSAVLVKLPVSTILVPEARFQALFEILTKSALVNVRSDGLLQVSNATEFEYGNFDVETLEEQK